jgi:hypothetical protein
MGDSMTMGDFATFMTVEVLMSAYGTLALSRPVARQRLLVNTNYDAATAAWFDLRWPLEGE